MQEPNQRISNPARSDAMRQRLIEAARALFVAKGFAATGTPEIVEAATVTRGALYHHFADKADLFRAVVRAEAEAVARVIAAVPPQSDPAEDLRAGAIAWLGAMQHQGRVRLLLVDGPSVLGQQDIAEIDRQTGAAELRLGLAAVMRGADPALVSALADMLSAGFDRAALAISMGASRAVYEAALIDLLDRLTRQNHGSRG